MLRISSKKGKRTVPRKMFRKSAKNQKTVIRGGVDIEDSEDREHRQEESFSLNISRPRFVSYFDQGELAKSSIERDISSIFDVSSNSLSNPNSPHGAARFLKIMKEEGAVFSGSFVLHSLLLSLSPQVVQGLRTDWRAGDIDIWIPRHSRKYENVSPRVYSFLNENGFYPDECKSEKGEVYEWLVGSAIIHDIKSFTRSYSEHSEFPVKIQFILVDAEDFETSINDFDLDICQVVYLPGESIKSALKNITMTAKITSASASKLPSEWHSTIQRMIKYESRGFQVDYKTAVQIYIHSMIKQVYTRRQVHPGIDIVELSENFIHELEKENPFGDIPGHKVDLIVHSGKKYADKVFAKIDNAISFSIELPDKIIVNVDNEIKILNSEEMKTGLTPLHNSDDALRALHFQRTELFKNRILGTKKFDGGSHQGIPERNTA